MITILNFNARKEKSFISVLLQYDLAEKKYTYTELWTTEATEQTRTSKSDSIISATADYQAMLKFCTINDYKITVA